LDFFIWETPPPPPPFDLHGDGRPPDTKGPRDFTVPFFFIIFANFFIMFNFLLFLLIFYYLFCYDLFYYYIKFKHNL
jgi:hypothetical protein